MSSGSLVRSLVEEFNEIRHNVTSADNTDFDIHLIAEMEDGGYSYDPLEKYDYNPDDIEFDPKVFWSVNAFILCMLLSLCVWCIYFGGKDSLTRWASRARETDLEYQRAILQRREQEAAAKLETPAVRTANLKRCFEKNCVTMVVTEDDIVHVLPSDTVECSSMPVEDEKPDEKQTIDCSFLKAEEGRANEEPVTIVGQQNEGMEHDTNIENKTQEETTDSDTDPVVDTDSDRGNSSECSRRFSFTASITSMARRASLANSVASGHGSVASGHGSMVGSVVSHWGGSQLSCVTGYLRLRPGLPNKKKTKKSQQQPQPKPQRYIQNCCAVCLAAYEVDETVVWSCNDACVHAFHEECILEWLVKMQDGTPCPCCRQEFTNLERNDGKNKKERFVGGRSFNVGAINL